MSNSTKTPLIIAVEADPELVMLQFALESIQRELLIGLVLQVKRIKDLTLQIEGRGGIDQKVPLIVQALTDTLAETLAIDIMDQVVPDWRDRV